MCAYVCLCASVGLPPLSPTSLPHSLAPSSVTDAYAKPTSFALASEVSPEPSLSVTPHRL